jgi:hypothetical protein
MSDNFTIVESLMLQNTQYRATESKENLISSISLAVCSILLSLTGFMVACWRSRCKVIECCGGGVKCVRDVEPV